MMKLKKGFLSLSPLRYIALGTLALILIGTVLLMLPAASRAPGGTSFLDAFFVSTSATCVTGLVSVPTYEHWSLFGQIVLLVLIQIGGIGFMSVVTFLSMSLGRKISLSERQRFLISAGENTLGGAARLLRSVIGGTFLVEGIGAGILFVRFLSLGWSVGRAAWYAVFHSVSAFCNAGFDLMGAFGQSSLCGFTGDLVVNLTVCTLILIGGLGFVVWRDLAEHKLRFSAYRLHTKIVLTGSALLLVIGTLLMFLFEWGNDAIPLTASERVLSALFNAVTPRTAGFNTVDLGKLTDGTLAFMMLLMVIGGAPGSTAGGIKITTLTALLLGTAASARKSQSASLFRRRLESDALRQASAIATIYFSIASTAVLILCGIEKLPVREVLFEVISALSNVGMTLSVTPSLGALSKIVIALLMYFGRIGLLSLAMVLSERRESVPIDRPEEEILLG